MVTSETNVALIRRLLANTLDPEVLNDLVAPDATYISLTYENPQLTKILPWAGTSYSGSAAIIKAFGGVERHWTNESFEILEIFGDDGENVAVFGKFTYRSKTLSVANTSPFSMWCKVRGGKVVFLQFLEDSFGTTNTFYVGGTRKYRTQDGNEDIEV